LNRLARDDAGLTIGGSAALAISARRGMHFSLQIRPPRRSYHTRCTAAGGCFLFRKAWKRAALSRGGEAR
jgi:hypothetical protein